MKRPTYGRIFPFIGLTARLSEEASARIMKTIEEIERRFNARGRNGENEDVTGKVAKEILESAL